MEQSTENHTPVEEILPQQQQYEVISPNISRSETNNLRAMHQEYQDVLFYGKNNSGEIYLVDVLE